MLRLHRERLAPDVRLIRVADSEYRHTFFGYYDRSPWCKENTRLLYAATNEDELPDGRQALTIGVWDRKTNEYRHIGETRTWNFQQAAQQQWTRGGNVVFNTMRDDREACVIVDPADGSVVRAHSFHVGVVHRRAHLAASYSFARLQHHERDYGYPRIKDEHEGIGAPNGVALEVRCLADGASDVRLTFDDVYRALSSPDELLKRIVWVQHAKFNPSGTKILFVLRTRVDDTAKSDSPASSHLFVYDRRERRLEVVLRSKEWKLGASHPTWYDEDSVLMNLYVKEYGARKLIRFRAFREGYEVLAPRYEGYGHPTVGERDLLISDERVPHELQRLLAFDLSNGRRHVLGVFRSPAEYQGPVRCDLHPRYNSPTETVCFDSAMSGSRAIYLADISGIRLRRD